MIFFSHIKNPSVIFFSHIKNPSVIFFSHIKNPSVGINMIRESVVRDSNPWWKDPDSILEDKKNQRMEKFRDKVYF